MCQFCPLALLLFLIGISPSPAQVITGQLTGRVTDSSGAVVPRSEVIVVNAETGLERKAATNEEGYCTVPLLPPGSSQITVRRDGFRPVAHSGIVL